MSKNVETKGKFKVFGKVVDLDFSQGVNEKGANKGKKYRRLQVTLETKPDHKVFINMAGFEEDYVYPYSREKGSATKIPFSQRHNPPAGHIVLGMNLRLNGTDPKTGEDINGPYHDYDAVDIARSNISVGDWLYISGQTQFRKIGDNTIYNLKPNAIYIPSTRFVTDFESPDFKEVCELEQEIIINDVLDKSDDDLTYVNTYQIMYDGSFIPYQFVIDKENTPKLSELFKKKLKTGDQLKVWAKIENRHIVTEVEEDEDDVWGTKPESFKSSSGFERKLIIIGADKSSYQKGKYKKSDFVVKEEDPFSDQDTSDDILDEEDPFSD